MSLSAHDAVADHFRWIDGHADVWAIFRDAEALAVVVTALAEPFRGTGVTAVCGVESRGFLLGAAVAVELGVGFVPIRKGLGMLPGTKLARRSAPDYRGIAHTLRLQRSSLRGEDRVVLVDDWIETGNQAAAVKEMVEQAGAGWAGCSVVIDQLTNDTHRDILGPVISLLAAQQLPPQRKSAT
ncbi:phosphoribosyltransferase family protein [Nocardia sp. NPDC046763]|uniref:phosphoribosyltransferase family protein n=1 Tax=Nocardia sp. NPDC046763 TaxID=3155256 RepID=UPI0033C4C372